MDTGIRNILHCQQMQSNVSVMQAIPDPPSACDGGQATPDLVSPRKTFAYIVNTVHIAQFRTDLYVGMQHTTC